MEHIEDSLLQDEACCLICYDNQQLRLCPVFPGDLEEKSRQYGLQVWLCPRHFAQYRQAGANHDLEFDRWLQDMACKSFQKYFPERNFQREFIKPGPKTPVC